MAFTYFFLLYEKVNRPNFKNMNDSEALYFGIIVVIFLVIDFLLLKRWMQKIRHR